MYFNLKTVCTVSPSDLTAHRFNPILYVTFRLRVQQDQIKTEGVILNDSVRNRLLIGVTLSLCCYVVYSTRRFVLSLALCYFVLVFFSPFSITITSLGEERANFGAFLAFVRFALVWFCLFTLPLCIWDGLRPVTGLFSYPFLSKQSDINIKYII